MWTFQNNPGGNGKSNQGRKEASSFESPLFGAKLLQAILQIILYCERYTDKRHGEIPFLTWGPKTWILSVLHCMKQLHTNSFDGLAVNVRIAVQSSKYSESCLHIRKLCC